MAKTPTLSSQLIEAREMITSLQAIIAAKDAKYAALHTWAEKAQLALKELRAENLALLAAQQQQPATQAQIDWRAKAEATKAAMASLKAQAAASGKSVSSRAPRPATQQASAPAQPDAFARQAALSAPIADFDAEVDAAFAAMAL